MMYEMSFIKVFILSTIMSYIITIIFVVSIKENITINILIGCIFLAMLFASFIIYAVLMMRKSIIFWDAVYHFQVDLKKVKTKQDVELLNSKFDKLKKLSLGGPHSMKLVELRLIMMTKFEFIPDSDTNSVTNQ